MLLNCPVNIEIYNQALQKQLTENYTFVCFDKILFKRQIQSEITFYKL